jgi:hypothetical protein
LAVTMKITVFWGVTPRSLVPTFWRNLLSHLLGSVPENGARNWKFVVANFKTIPDWNDPRRACNNCRKAGTDLNLEPMECKSKQGNLVHALDYYKSTRHDHNNTYIEAAQEFVPTCIIVGIGSSDVLWHWK